MRRRAVRAHPPTFFVALLLVSCAASSERRTSGGPAASAPSPGRHVVPNGLVHVTLVGFDDGPVDELAAEEGTALREATNARLKETYRDAGHERWFFHAFDDDALHFVIARWEPRDPVGGRYIATRRIRRVARSRSAARALGVSATLAQYERGSGGVRAGMGPADVEAAKGKPERVQQLGPFGAYDWIYEDQCVRFLADEVAHVWERAACVR